MVLNTKFQDDILQDYSIFRESSVVVRAVLSRKPNIAQRFIYKHSRFLHLRY